MSEALIIMERKLFSNEKCKFECNFADEYSVLFRQPYTKLYKNGNEIFSTDSGIDKFYYNAESSPVHVEYEKRSDLILHISNSTKLAIRFIGSGLCKSEYNIMLNNGVIGRVHFSSGFFPYKEKYKLESCVNDSINADLLLFSLLALYSHDAICTL